MLELLQRIARRTGEATPNQGVRNVLNALIQSEGDRYPALFADFLRRGGCKVLYGFKQFIGAHGPFAEFIGKLLWLAWDSDTQAAFLQADTTGAEALSLLSALFASGTKSGQIMAGLLLSSLIANDCFASDREREHKAAAGVSGLVEDLVVVMPSGLTSIPQGSQEPKDEDTQAAETFLASVGRNERSFGRLLACVLAPCDQEAGVVVATEAEACWSPCAFALWCLVKVRPQPARVAIIRPLLPGLAQAGTLRVRWLVGALLLHLHQEASGAAASASSASAPSDQPRALAMSTEKEAVEAAMVEQINHMLGQLRGGLEENSGLVRQQLDLVSVRDRPLAVGSDGSWSAQLDLALQGLADVRGQLKKGAAAAQDSESRSTGSLEGLHRELEQNLDASADAEMARALASVQELEVYYEEKREEWRLFDEAHKELDAQVDVASKAMEEADRRVVAMRKLISDLEQELSGKQREAQTMRMLASSDNTATKARLEGEIEQVDNRLSSLRAKAAKLQTGGDGSTPPMEPAKVTEIMAQIKQEAQKMKTKRADLHAELQKVSADPKTLEESACRAERQAVELQEQLTKLRSFELSELERAHLGSRQVWQTSTTQQQDIRVRRDAAGRESDELSRQLADRWRVWRPLWAERLKTWQARSRALSEAQVCGRKLETTVGDNWTLLEKEQAARRDALQAVAAAQQALADLVEQLVAVGDLR